MEPLLSPCTLQLSAHGSHRRCVPFIQRIYSANIGRTAQTVTLASSTTTTRKLLAGRIGHTCGIESYDVTPVQEISGVNRSLEGIAPY